MEGDAPRGTTQILAETPLAGYVAPVLTVIGSRRTRRPEVRRSTNNGATIFNLPPPPDWSPAVNVFDTGSAYVVIAELAGVGPDSLRIELDAARDVLTLRGTRAARAPVSTAPLDEEITTGHFEREISFDHPVDANNTRAVCRYGLLELLLPKLRLKSNGRRQKSGGGGIRTLDTLAGIAV